MLEDFHFDLDVLLEELEKRGWTKIAVQAPEGLMRSAIELSRAMGGLGLETIVLVNPCYGACDLAQTPEGFHGVVHLGHAHFPGQDAVFVELPSKADNLGAIEENCHLMPDRIGLAATVQHLGLLENAKTILEKCGKRAYIGQGRGRSVHGGQVLGCNLSSARDVEAEVDAFLFIGTGRFHPEGMAMSTGKKVFALDPATGEMDVFDSERFLRKRHALIAKAGQGKKYAVLVSSKPGQARMEEAGALKKALQEKGKEAEILLGDNLPPERFMGMDFDAFISTACPRLALDDGGNYPGPVITPLEARIMLGMARWDDYRMDELE